MISEEIKSLSLAVFELCLSEGISRSVSQSVEKFAKSKMKRFRIDLNTFWAWLCLTNTPKLSESKYQAGFGVAQNPLTFMIPLRI